MKVLALDLSTKSAGWAVFENKKLVDNNCDYQKEEKVRFEK